MKDLFSEKYKTVMKETEDGTKFWKVILRSWIVKMAILPKEMNRFKVTPIKTTTHDIYQKTTTNNRKCI